MLKRYTEQRSMHVLHRKHVKEIIKLQKAFPLGIKEKTLK